MTKAEFLKGWTFLTTQPWGKSYRGTSPEAVIQVEFYYKHVNQANPIVWVAVCEHAATGGKWPSLDELKQSLTANGGYIQANQRLLSMPYRLAWEESPEPLNACFAYRKQHDCSFADAYLAILPVWLEQNVGHENYRKASTLLESVKKNFGLPRGKAGNMEVPL